MAVGEAVDVSSVVLPDGDGLPETVGLEVGASDFVGVLLGVGERLVRVGSGVFVCSGVTVWPLLLVAGEGGGRTSRYSVNKATKTAVRTHVDSRNRRNFILGCSGLRCPASGRR